MAIADRSRQCVRSFGRLAEFAQQNVGGYESQVSITTVSDEFGRFKIWAGNIGALQEDSRSLDYRLREASQVRDQVTKILQDLEFSLHECIAIVSGQRAQRERSSSEEEDLGDEFSDTSDSESSDTSKQEAASELAHLFLAITEAITSLYKLSISIRNPAPRDRYAKAASLNSFDVSYDVGHVYEKYPHVRSTPWLMDRVGRAITRRREFLRYREKHREKLATNIRPIDMSDRNRQAETREMAPFNALQTPTEGPVLEIEARSTNYSQLASTEATTYVANLNDENLEIGSIAGRSETTYVTSIAEEDSYSMREIPDPPKESANGMPFECPYCFTVLSVKNTKYWKKHVMCDLRPYLCTFEGCSTQMFESRREWFQHELDKHRKEWHCCLCSNEMPFSSAGHLKAHLYQNHSEYSGQQASALLSLCEKPPENIPVSACPFCAWDSNYSIDPPDFFDMTSISSSKDLWDSYKVLGVYPNAPNFTCIGVAKSTGSRCRWPFNSEQFDTSQRASAVKCLESMSKMHPSKITLAALALLAQNTLCRNFHQRQAGDKITEWKAKIEKYLHEHSERLPVVSAVNFQGKKSVEGSDLPADGPILHRQSGDRNVHHGPVVKARSVSSPTVMVSSLQFQRHVAHHLEQLALFALPPPMRDSSGASSDQAAASHNSDHTTGADAISEISSQPSTPTDYGSTPELYGAVMGGEIRVVRREIRNGADLTLQWGRFGNVLQAAAASLSWPSRDEILRALLNNGAHANMQGGLYGNALQAVAANPGVSGRRLQALELLLDHGAEVNAAGGEYGYAIVAAAAIPTPPSPMQQEPTSMVLNLLLDHGANIDAQEPMLYGSALHQAIEHNDVESVKVLLDRGASTTLYSEEYGTPVEQAKTLSYGPVWQLLQKADFETNLQRRKNRVRLSAALKIQRNFRHRLHLEQKSRNNIVRLSAALKIQRNFRHRLHLEQKSRNNIVRLSAALKIQRNFRHRLHLEQKSGMQNKPQTRVHFDNKVGVTTFSQIEQPSTLYYGVSLEELCQREKRPVPKLITDCIEAVELYGMGTKEVYRGFHTDWNQILVDNLKAEYNRDPESLSPQRLRIPNNIAYVAQLLKDFIWQLPGLLIPRQTLARFVRAAHIVARQRIGHLGYEKGEGQAATELRAAIRELPQVNRDAFESLVRHFQRVADKASQNTMTSGKLAAALAPSFKGGVDSGAGPKLPLADLAWALEYIIRRGDFWFRDASEPPDVADDVEAAQPTCTVCRESFTLKETATEEEGLRALPCGHVFSS